MGGLERAPQAPQRSERHSKAVALLESVTGSLRCRRAGVGDDLAQAVLLDLAARGHRELGHELETLGELLAREPSRLEVGHQLRQRRRLAGYRNHERADALLES